MQLIIVSAVARHLGSKSRSELYKLINDGWLDAHTHAKMPSWQRLLDVEGLQTTLQGFCLWHVDGFLFERLFDVGCFILRSMGISLLGQTLVAEACRTVSKSSSRSF